MALLAVALLVAVLNQLINTICYQYVIMRRKISASLYLRELKMWKFLIMGLIALNIALLGAIALKPANATTPANTYFWGYSRNLGEGVICKKALANPIREIAPPSETEGMKMQFKYNSVAVSDRFCAGLPKPF